MLFLLKSFSGLVSWLSLGRRNTASSPATDFLLPLSSLPPPSCCRLRLSPGPCAELFADHGRQVACAALAALRQRQSRCARCAALIADTPGPSARDECASCAARRWRSPASRTGCPHRRRCPSRRLTIVGVLQRRTQQLVNRRRHPLLGEDQRVAARLPPGGP